MNPSSILVVDDEPNNFDVIETFLSEPEYELHYADSGAEAIASLEGYNPDLILLDVMMPGIDGIEVCRQIKAMSKWQAVPIIMVTALGSTSDLARCLNAGADDFLSKPVNTIELRARVSAMLRIKHQYDDLQNLLKLREDLVQMLVHDLRNPLSCILGNADILKTKGYPQEKYPGKVEQIHYAAKLLEGLIDDLLQITLIESGKLRLNRTLVKIPDLIQSALLKKFEAIAAQKNQSIIIQLPDSSPVNLSLDLPLFHRTIDNLISNALKFSPRNSQIIINVEILNSGHIKIQVIDSGPGVPDELKKAIFEKYEIGTKMSEISQIGLGLAFCKMVVEAHQGQIQVMNNQPKGSIFEITIPSAETEVISAY